MHPADTLTRIALERHRERTALARLGGDVAPVPSPRLRMAAALRRAADRLDAGPPEPASMRPLISRG